jgi:2-haloacid dehalogenase
MAIYLFDAYGTLLDVNAAVHRHAAKIGDKAARLSEMWRNKQLEYTWIRTLTGLPWQDFEALTAQGLDFALHKLAINDPALREDLLALYLKLDAFPDVYDSLKTLKLQGHDLAILSNGSHKMLHAACDHAKITPLFTHIFSVDALQKYKTSKGIYQLAAERFNVAPQAITFLSSNRWDIAAAHHFGFKTLWLNRAGNPDEYADAPPDAIIHSLQELVEIARAK